jgi:hypothetical protein
MATLKLNNTTVFTETNGAASIPSGVTIGNGVKFPAGHIVQIVYNVPTTVTLASTTTTSYAEIQTEMRTSIIPKFSNSLLILEWDALHGGNNTGNILAAKFYDVTNNTDVHSSVPALGTGSARVFSHGSERQNDWDLNDRSTFKMKTVISAQNTNSRTYSIYAKTEGTTHYWNMTGTDNSGCTYAPFCFTIMEIAQ